MSDRILLMCLRCLGVCMSRAVLRILLFEAVPWSPIGFIQVARRLSLQLKKLNKGLMRRPEVNFCTYATTYTLPCILPFVAATFPETGRQQSQSNTCSVLLFAHMANFAMAQERSQQCHLLLNMMIFQSIGDVSGRMLAPTSKQLGQV